MCKTNIEILSRNIRVFFPNAEIAEDNDGQVVIYTNMSMPKEDMEDAE